MFKTAVLKIDKAGNVHEDKGQEKKVNSKKSKQSNKKCKPNNVMSKEQFIDYYSMVNYIVLWFLLIVTVLFIINIEYRSLYIKFGRLNIYKWFSGNEPAYKAKLGLLVISLINLLKSGLIAIDLLKVKLFGFRIKTSYIIVTSGKNGEINGKYCTKYINWSSNGSLRIGQRYKVDYLCDSFRKYIISFNEVTVDGAVGKDTMSDKELIKKAEREAVKKKIVSKIKRNKTINMVKRKYGINNAQWNRENKPRLGLYTTKENEISIKDNVKENSVSYK